MCKVYNEVGCLTTIMSHLRAHGINEVKTLNEVINFRNNYSGTRQEVVLKHQLLIEKERIELSEKIASLQHSIDVKKAEVEHRLLLKVDGLNNRIANLPKTHSNKFNSIIDFFKRSILELQIWHNKYNFDFEVAKALEYLTKENDSARNRYQYIISSFENAVMQSGSAELEKLDGKKRAVDEINTSIYGALGELKVVKELEKLSDEYVLINDFNCTFDPPIYDYKERSYIRSVQIDHILISPAGIFLIETKNWSQDSLNNKSLYSPVQQIKRANTALFKILNNEIAKGNFAISKHHWGDRKIAVKNLIVLINYKPMEEFQYVKILTLNRLLGYVNYFEPCFSFKEVNGIAHQLLSLAAR